MALPNDYVPSRLIKKFATLGPYLRTEQCVDEAYLFDSLVVCVNDKIVPERREFWGWWLDLQANEDGFTYRYLFGLYDNQGVWQEKALTDKTVQKAVEQNLLTFHQKLQNLFNTLQFSWRPADDFSEELIRLSA